MIAATSSDHDCILQNENQRYLLDWNMNSVNVSYHRSYSDDQIEENEPFERQTL